MALPAGNRFMFVDRPLLTVSANPASGVAGQPIPALGYSVAGVVNGDAPNSVLGGALVTSATLADTGAVGFVSRDGAVRWRLAGSGVERSADGGATWTASALNGLQELDERRPAAPQSGAAAVTAAPAAAAQAQGPGAVAGDAPTASVCWLVGPRGAVWLTTDGGQRFRRMTVPGEPDLGVVAARDARSADVSAVDGRTFRTDDGGSTWTPTSP